jgi:hypothetical protein
LSEFESSFCSYHEYGIPFVEKSTLATGALQVVNFEQERSDTIKAKQIMRYNIEKQLGWEFAEDITKNINN